MRFPKDRGPLLPSDLPRGEAVARWLAGSPPRIFNLHRIVAAGSPFIFIQTPSLPRRRASLPLSVRASLPAGNVALLRPLLRAGETSTVIKGRKGHMPGAQGGGSQQRCTPHSYSDRSVNAWTHMNECTLALVGSLL